MANATVRIEIVRRWWFPGMMACLKILVLLGWRPEGARLPNLISRGFKTRVV